MPQKHPHTESTQTNSKKPTATTSSWPGLAKQSPRCRARGELAHFIAKCRDGTGTDVKGEYVGFIKGSFDSGLAYTFDDAGPDVIIRFPKPGLTPTALADEKVVNEVAVMEYLRQHTDIPVPRVYSLGLGNGSPQDLGPFIIMGFVKGTLLSSVLKQQDQEEDLVLDPGIDNAVLDKIYA